MIFLLTKVTCLTMKELISLRKRPEIKIRKKYKTFDQYEKSHHVETSKFMVHHDTTIFYRIREIPSLNVYPQIFTTHITFFLLK